MTKTDIINGYEITLHPSTNSKSNTMKKSGLTRLLGVAVVLIQLYIFSHKNEQTEYNLLPLNIAPWTSMLVVKKNQKNIQKNNINVKFINNTQRKIISIGVSMKQKKKQPRYSAEREIGSCTFGVYY